MPPPLPLSCDRPDIMTEHDILELLRLPLPKLQALASEERSKGKGSHVFVRGLLEFSSLCHRNCLYCGLRKQNTRLERYTLTREQLLSAAEAAYRAGVDTFVLQSGEWDHDPKKLADCITTLKERFGLPVTLSVGEHKREDYALWRRAGADRYLIKHETASPELYARLHPGYTLEERVGALRTLAELGYETGSGFIIGLPGQTLEILARDILLVRNLHVAMCGVGPFVPQSATPMAKVPAGSVELTLRVISVLRLILPWANLPATTALASLSPVQGQRDGLLAGANVLMPSFTPPERRKSYTIYDNKAQVTMQAVREAIAQAGLAHTLDEAMAARTQGSALQDAEQRTDSFQTVFWNDEE